MLHQSNHDKGKLATEEKYNFRLWVQHFPFNFFSLYGLPFLFSSFLFDPLATFIFLHPNANFPSAVAWVGSSLNGRSETSQEKLCRTC